MKRPILALAIGLALAVAVPLSAAPATDLKAQLAAATRAGDLQSVAEIYRRLFAAQPKDVDVLRGLIRAELTLGNSDAARVLVGKLEQTVAADDAGLLEYRGDLLLLEGKSVDASRAWQSALKSDPENADLLAKLAMHFLYRDRNPATAAVYFQRLLPLRDTAMDHIQVGTVAIAMRDWTVLIERTTALKTRFATDSSAKKQIPAFERIIDATMQIAELDAREKNQADPVPVILRRGRLFLDLGFPELALNDARRALKLKPNAVHVRLHFAAAAARLGVDFHKISNWGINANRYRKTAPRMEDLDRLAELDTAIFDNPDEMEALSSRAQLLHRIGEFTIAGVDAEHLHHLDPDHVQALRILALVALGDGYFGKATQLVDKALVLAPNDLLVLDAATDIHSRQGNFERTIELCDHWLAQSGDKPKTALERRQSAMENLQKTDR
jgi:tetratricopeptide (TPR) repeat protein